MKLEEIFEEDPSPTFALREALADEFGATVRQVSIWFRNRRQRVRLSGLTTGPPAAKAAKATAKAKQGAAAPKTDTRTAPKRAATSTAHDDVEHESEEDDEEEFSDGGEQSASEDEGGSEEAAGLGGGGGDDDDDRSFIDFSGVNDDVFDIALLDDDDTEGGPLSAAPTSTSAGLWQEPPLPQSRPHGLGGGAIFHRAPPLPKAPLGASQPMHDRPSAPPLSGRRPGLTTVPAPGRTGPHG